MINNVPVTNETATQMSAREQRVSADKSANNEELTRYLFGEMSETEQMQFELRYFDDPQRFAELCTWRNDLIDHYVAGELSPSMRERFEAGIENSWAINERIRFAETLQDAVEKRGTTSASHSARRSFRTFTKTYRRPLLEAALVLVLLALVWLVLRIFY
jgi:anti-sigma factor RsiW